MSSIEFLSPISQSCLFKVLSHPAKNYYQLLLNWWRTILMAISYFRLNRHPKIPLKVVLFTIIFFFFRFIPEWGYNAQAVQPIRFCQICNPPLYFFILFHLVIKNLLLLTFPESFYGVIWNQPWGKERPKKKADYSRLVNGRFDKQGNLWGLTWLHSFIRSSLLYPFAKS